MRRVPFLHWRHIISYAAIAAATASFAGLHAQTATRGAATKSAPIATVKSVTRTALPRGERITVELSAEVRFTSERVPTPDRVYFDFERANVASAIVASAKALPSGSLVAGVRMGQFTSTAARLVLDLSGHPRYSAFAMYDPFRLVIDVESDPSGVAAAKAPAAAAPAPAVPAPVAAAPPIETVATTVTTAEPVSTVPPPALIATPVPVAPPAPTPPATETVPLDAVAAKLGAPAPAAMLSRSRDYSLSRQLGLGVSRIVIDPGHGGHDPGAHGVGIVESELVLDVALRLEKLLKEQQGVDVVVTRRTDEFIPLEERTAIANREGADLFLSIHANASTRPTARGIETYFLNFATDPEAEAVAARENATSGRGMGKLPDLVKTIALNNKVVESRELATLVQASMFKRLQLQNKTIKNLGVKQAPFVVLIGAEMPSILAEISFVTNKTEASLLKQATYRQRIAQSLADGVLRYQSSLKRAPTMAVRAQGQ